MAEIDRMIAECAELRSFYVERRNSGERGAGIEALAVAILEVVSQFEFSAACPVSNSRN